MMNDQTMNDRLMQDLGKGFNEILKSFITTNVVNKEMKFWTGKVINNNDPDKLGRCRIRVYGMFSDKIPDDDLPWATPDFNFIGGSSGSFIVPPIDSLVRVYFDNNDVYAPMYTTKAFNKGTTFKGDISEDYPDTMVFFETDQGEYFKINRKTQKTTYKHSSGATVIIDIDGNITINNKASTVGNLTINIEGNTNINTKGDTSVISLGNVTVDGTMVNLGKNLAKQLVNNLPVCLVTGAPHAVGNINVKC